MKEDRFELTPEGVLSCDLSEEGVKKTLDHLELYMRRCGYNGILLARDGFMFVNIIQNKKGGKK